MLIKTGDAEIIDIVDPKDVEDDDKRKDALAAALEKAKTSLSEIAVPTTDVNTEN